METDNDITFSGYTWNGTVPAGFTLQSYQNIEDELLKQVSGNPVYSLASGFVDWLKSLTYTVSSAEYNALEVDIDGNIRNSAAYWPGCYQNQF